MPTAKFRSSRRHFQEGIVAQGIDVGTESGRKIITSPAPMALRMAMATRAPLLAETAQAAGSDGKAVSPCNQIQCQSK